MAETMPRGDEERLPWLESAEPEPEEGTPVWRTVLLLLIGLAVLGTAIWAFFRFDRPDEVAGSGDLIEAPGPYKVKPGAPGGMQVDGEGDTVFATSEGGTSNGSVDVGAVAEAPVARKVVRPTPTPTTAGGTRVVTQVPRAAEPLEARAPARPVPAAAPAGGGGAVVQLGSFPSEAGANRAWTTLSNRFVYLAPLGKSVQAAEVNGSTTYRLRVNTGSAGQAREICGRLKVAGEACFIAQ